MRLILANPHYHSYGKTVINVLLRRKHFLKYDFFLQDYLKDPKKELAFYIDGTKTTFAAVKIRFPLFPKFFAWLELIAWMLINGISPFRHRVYFHISSLDPKNDVVVDFARSFRLSEQKKSGLTEFQGLIFIFLTHYFLRTREVSSYLASLRFPLLTAENDLTTNEYFHTYFPHVEEVYHLPFTFAERFVPGRSFIERLNKCVALGSISPVEKSNQEYRTFFQNDVVQPMRKIILEHQNQYLTEIDSLISQFQNAGQHQKYYRFNIVDKYNEYRMFVCPEEAPGLPSINVFEGMACGTAFLGIDDPMYTNLGLIPGVHYISYEQNNLSDLIQKIRYYQNNPESLQKIAETGRDFVRTHFHKQAVADTLWHDLETMSGEFAATGKFELKCSFVKEVKK